MELKQYIYRSSDLYQVFKEVGISKEPKKYLARKRAEGKFSPPTEGKFKVWKFTADQLIEIAQAFSPGGKGEWHFEGN